MSAISNRTTPSSPAEGAPWVPPQQGKWTVDDYMRLTNPPGYRYELIDGGLLMSPSPNFWHQSAVGVLFELMSSYVRKRGLGVVIVAPFDVLLSADNRTALQPDLLFIRQDRQSIIRSNWVDGAPDLVVEVLSPSSEDIDRQLKWRKYLESGVIEYWILDPDRKTIEIWVRRQEMPIPVTLGRGAVAASEVIAGFTASVDEVFSG